MNSKTRKRIQNRKYGGLRHKQARAEARLLVDLGGVRCARCGEPIEPGSPVDVGHDDRFPEYYSGQSTRSAIAGRRT